jgi:Undecaprenyl-phosphate glucose phosphotransferase
MHRMNTSERSLPIEDRASGHDASPLFSGTAAHDPDLHTRTSRLNLSDRSLPIVAAVTEFATVVVAAICAGALYQSLAFDRPPLPGFYFLAVFCLAVLFVVPCGVAGDYSIRRLCDRKGQLKLVLLRWNSAYSLFVFALFMTHATDFYSRGTIVFQYVLGLAAAMVSRSLLRAAVMNGLRSGALQSKKIVVIGSATTIDETIRRLKLEGQGVNVVRAVRLSGVGSSWSKGGIASVEEVRHAVATIQDAARQEPVDEIVIDLPWSATDLVQRLVDGLAIVPATIHLAPNHAISWARDPACSRIGLVRTIRLLRAPMTFRDRVLKRTFDVIATVLILVASAPLLAVVAIAIRIDSRGPVFFRQRRHGFNHQEFRVFKFRTMKTTDDGLVIRQAVRNDDRITFVGRILRSTNLDELPQLFNVLAGDMSLVGPRPHALAHNNEYEALIQQYAWRHRVKPGITGWAQLNGFRGETSSIEKMHRRIDCDLFYIDNWSLTFDLKILILTPFSRQSYLNAY